MFNFLQDSWNFIDTFKITKQKNLYINILHIFKIILSSGFKKLVGCLIWMCKFKTFKGKLIESTYR